MSKRRVPQAGALVVVVLTFAACAAALVSHVAIDIAGDYLLPHDTYDGLEHQSRSDIFALAITLGLYALLRVVSGALRAARDVPDYSGATFERSIGRAPWRCTFAVIALTIAALGVMEAYDVAGKGGTVDDLADLFGGSLALGLSITVPIAVLSTFGALVLARVLLVSQRRLAVALGRLIALLSRGARRSNRRTQRRGSPARRYRSVSARRSAKRGPPLVTS